MIYRVSVSEFCEQVIFRLESRVILKKEHQIAAENQKTRNHS